MAMRVPAVLPACVLLVLASLACPAESAAQGRKELRVGVPGVPVSLDPAAALEGATPLIARQVFDTLVAYREGSTDIEPALALRWAVSREGLVWTFALREGVRFHDGSPLTADEVAASFQRQLSPEAPGRRGRRCCGDGPASSRKSAPSTPAPCSSPSASPTRPC